jgi:hypothetical protein
LQGDHSQIHLKWVIEYNTNSTQHFVIVLNGEKTLAHWGAICLKISGMMLVTKIAFGLIMALVKKRSKSKLYLALPKCVVASTFELHLTNLFYVVLNW